MKNDVLFSLSSDVSDDDYSIDLNENVDLQIKEFLVANSSAGSITLLQRAGTRTISSLTMPVDALRVSFDSPLECFIKHQVNYADRPNGTLIINDVPILSKRDLMMLFTMTETLPMDFFTVSVVVNGEAHSVCMNCNAAKTPEFLKDLFTALNSPRKSSITYKKFSGPATDSVSVFFILVWDENESLAEIFIDANDESSELFNAVLRGYRTKHLKYALVDLADLDSHSQSQPQPQPTPSNLVFEVDDYPCDSSEDIDCALESLNYGDSFSLHVVDPSGREVNCAFTVNEITGLFLASSLKAMSQPIPKSIVYLAFVPEDKLKNPMCSYVFILVWNEQCTLQSCWFANDILYSDVVKYLDDTQYLYRDYTMYCFGTEMYDSKIAMHQNKSVVDRSANAPISLGNTLTTGKLDEKLFPSEPTPPESDLISITPSELFGNNSVNNTSPRKQGDSINLQVHYLVNDKKSVSCAEPFTSVEDFVTALKSVAEESKTLAVHCGLPSSIASETLQNLLEGFLEIFAQIKTPSKFTTIFNCFTKLAVKLQSNNFMLVNLDVAVKCCHAIFKIPNYEESYVVLENSLVMLKCPSEVFKELIADVAIALQNNGYIISRSDEFSTVVMWPINPSVSRFKDFLFTFKTTSSVSVEGVQLFNVFCNGVRVRTLATPREIERFLNSLVNQHYTLQSISVLPSEFAKQFNRIHNGYVKFIPE